MQTKLLSILIILLLATSLLAEKRLFAISEIKASSGISSEEAELIADRLRLELHNTGFATVVERGEMEAILQEQEFQSSGMCDENTCLVEMGKILGVEYIVTGTIGRVGSVIMVNLRTIDITTGALVKGVSEDISGDLSNVIKYLPKLAKKLIISPEKVVEKAPLKVKKAKVEKKKSPKKIETLDKDKNSSVFVQVGGLFTTLFNETEDSDGNRLRDDFPVKEGWGPTLSFGIKHKRHLLRLNGEFLFPDDFISGGGAIYNFSIVKSENHDLSLGVLGGFWYGEKYSNDDKNLFIEETDFVGSSILYIYGNSDLRFYFEAISRFGTYQEKYDENSEVLDGEWLGFYSRALFSAGITFDLVKF